MGDAISSVLGTNSQVNTQSSDPYQQIAQWQQYQQGLANQLQSQSAGGGPNPAQMQLLQNSQSIAQQAAQQNAQNRAINPGLAARFAGNQSVASGQQAAGQAGVQQAQQQLASQQLLGQVAGQAESGQNQASAINQQVAAGNQKAANGIVGGIMGGVGSMMGMAHGGMVQNMASGGMSGATGTVPFDPNNNGPKSMSGKFLSGVGDTMNKPAPGQEPDPLQSGVSKFTAGAGKYLSSGNSVDPDGLGSQFNATPSAPSLGADTSMGFSSAASAPASSGFSLGAQNLDDGGLVNPQTIQTLAKLAPLLLMAHGGFAEAIHRRNNPKAAGLKSGGGKVPGKSSVPGNSLQNDKIATNLSPGEIVIPRSVTMSKDAPKKAADFVAAVLAKQGAKK